jgi:hypothetical protein
MDETQLNRIEYSVESLHTKLDRVCEKVSAHEATISLFKAGFGFIATVLLATITYVFKSQS